MAVQGFEAVEAEFVQLCDTQTNCILFGLTHIPTGLCCFSDGLGRPEEQEKNRTGKTARMPKLTFLWMRMQKVLFADFIVSKSVIKFCENYQTTCQDLKLGLSVKTLFF